MENNNLAYAQNQMQRPNINQPYKPNQLNRPALEDNLNDFIQVNIDNQMTNN